MRATLTIETGRGDDAKTVTLPTALNRDGVGELRDALSAAGVSDAMKEWCDSIAKVLDDTEPSASNDELGDAGPLDTE